MMRLSTLALVELQAAVCSYWALLFTAAMSEIQELLLDSLEMESG